MTSKDAEPRLPTYGGQAVIEGVMMRGKHNLAMACRSPEGEIVLFQEGLPELYRSKWMKVPFVRGVISLWDALGMGMRMLIKAANVQTGEDEKIEGGSLFLTVGVSLLVSIAVFFLFPAFISGWLGSALHLGHWWSNLLEGLLRLLILVIYLWVVGKMPEINRVFMYKFIQITHRIYRRDKVQLSIRCLHILKVNPDTIIPLTDSI